MAINGRIIKFKNRKCSCGIKVAVKISESQNNPSKLYFFCERGKCNFYRFWDPDIEEFNQTEFLESNSQKYDDIEHFQLQQEMKSVMQKLELLWQRVQHLESLYVRMHNLENNIHRRMHNLKSRQGGQRLTWVVNMVLFGATMAVFVLSLTNNHGM
ncbi:hypothetical protein Ddye_011713 [Dipteronia dyeriana]|uniref:Zinc finger GRF-type domain-containing protein n=1 Tax=Dipteronia dyeriana TaxID=168575 RepID=A0AAD9X354_9ROSI|nr:hypothetical protein Ddye_011713 [Dipteronia dyeriana]